MTNLIVYLNGWPGTGKFTVGTQLTKRLNGILLDNHTMFNLAIALSDVQSDAYYKLCRQVRAIAFERILHLPPERAVVMTGMIAHGGPAAFAEEHWEEILALCKTRGSKLFSVQLECSTSELAKRVREPNRALNKKIVDDKLVLDLAAVRTIFDDGADFSLRLDNATLSPNECATEIQSWIGHCHHDNLND